MKKLLILLLFTISSQAQYVDFSIDANKALGIFDNHRTEIDHRGIDFDLEIGAIEGNWAGYAFYGNFSSAKYQNYGLGVDYYLLQNRNFHIVVGPQLTMILRKYPVGINGERKAWGTNMAYAGRLVAVLWLTDHWGISIRIQYQRRPDINTGILEGSIGLRYNFKYKR